MKDIQRQAQEDIEKRAGASVKPQDEIVAEEAVIETSTESPVEKEPIPEKIEEKLPVPEEEIKKEGELQPFKLKLPRIDLSGAKKILLKE